MERQGVLRANLSVAVGMRVMVTKNLKHPKVENGLIGTVTAIDAASISVVFSDPQRTVRIPRITEVKYKYGVKLTRKGFPLVPAFARTVHKVQGDTLTGPVYIDFTHIDRLGQAYVALSRIVDISQLFILPPGTQLTPALFAAHVPPTV